MRQVDNPGVGRQYLTEQLGLNLDLTDQNERAER